MKSNEEGIPCGSRKKVPFLFNLAWSTRGVAGALNVVLITSITYYCTDLLNLNPIVVGIMLIASKIVDAVTDLCAGFIIDHTNSKLGKARPYEIFVIFQWLFTVFLYSVPEIGTTGQYVWIFVMYVLVNAVCATMLGAADSVYMSRVFTTQSNQISAMSFNGVVVMFCAIVFSVLMPQFIAGTGTTKAGWTMLSLAMGIPLAIIGMMRFIFCKEVKKDAPVEADNNSSDHNSMSMKTMLGVVMKNKYIFIVVGLMLLTNVISGMTSVTATYYFKYIFGNVGLASLIGMTAMITPIYLMFFPLMAKKFGTTKILKGSLLLGIIGMVIRTICGMNLPVIMVGSLLSAIAIVPISTMINTYLIDCMDYGEWITGIRVEGLMASSANFAGKLGSAISSGLVGFVMGLAGYNGSLAQQSASANTAIVVLFNIVPLVIFSLMLLLSSMYKVDNVRQQMNADLAKKHGLES